MIQDTTKIHAFKCSKCGEVQELRFAPTTNAKLLFFCVCFDCNFWREVTILIDDPNQAIIDGNAYHAEPDNGGNPKWKGFGGRLHKIKFKADGRIVETTNLQYQGEVPERFKADLPDNAEFI